MFTTFIALLGTMLLRDKNRAVARTPGQQRIAEAVAFATNNQRRAGFGRNETGRGALNRAAAQIASGATGLSPAERRRFRRRMGL